LIGLENSRQQCFKTKTSSAMTKNAEFRSRGLQDCILHSNLLHFESSQSRMFSRSDF